MISTYHITTKIFTPIFALIVDKFDGITMLYLKELIK